MDDPMESDADDSHQSTGDSSVPMQQIFYDDEVFEVPEALLTQPCIFREVVSQDTWDNLLTDEQKDHLKNFLPHLENEEDEMFQEETVKCLLGRENIKFGNPVNQLYEKLRAGIFKPEIFPLWNQLKKASWRRSRYLLQQYFSKLLQRTLVNSQSLMEKSKSLRPGEHLRNSHAAPPSEYPAEVRHRTRHKYRSILREVRRECNFSSDSSSSESDVDFDEPIDGPLQYLDPDPAELSSTTQPTYQAQGKHGALSGPTRVNEKDYRLMLQEHIAKCSKSQVNNSGKTVKLKDVIRRSHTDLTGLSDEAKAKFRELQKRSKDREKRKKEKYDKKKYKEIKKKNKKKKREMEARLSMSGTQGVPPKTEVTAEVPPKRRKLSPSSVQPCLFTLIRDVLSDSFDNKVTTGKVEEHVRQWLDEASPEARAAWGKPGIEAGWLALVSSALMFLAGHFLDCSPGLTNFIPFVDYRERAGFWKWIGQDRDDTATLLKLNFYWKERLPIYLTKAQQARSQSIAPPRSKTNHKVRPITPTEKKDFQEQEKRRFENPHRAFTYTQHDYESVVGPIKGIYNKESTQQNKPREHVLLVNDRPAYVTILTLVRDAAARLPNGEGTRGDVCLLLKESQYLAKSVSDQQVYNVVSGALDRLHGERDPCVKYDTNQKTWVYLHRARSEQDFERIHQAQAAAAQAKRNIAKAKTNKKTKEAMMALRVMSAKQETDTPTEHPKHDSTLSSRNPDNMDWKSLQKQIFKQRAEAVATNPTTRAVSLSTTPRASAITESSSATGSPALGAGESLLHRQFSSSIDTFSTNPATRAVSSGALKFGNSGYGVLSQGRGATSLLSSDASQALIAKQLLKAKQQSAHKRVSVNKQVTGREAVSLLQSSTRLNSPGNASTGSLLGRVSVAPSSVTRPSFIVSNPRKHTPLNSQLSTTSGVSSLLAAHKQASAVSQASLLASTCSSAVTSLIKTQASAKGAATPVLSSPSANIRTDSPLKTAASIQGASPTVRPLIVGGKAMRLSVNSPGNLTGQTIRLPTGSQGVVNLMTRAGKPVAFTTRPKKAVTSSTTVVSGVTSEAGRPMLLSGSQLSATATGPAAGNIVVAQLPGRGVQLVRASGQTNQSSAAKFVLSKPNHTQLLQKTMLAVPRQTDPTRLLNLAGDQKQLLLTQPSAGGLRHAQFVRVVNTTRVQSVPVQSVAVAQQRPTSQASTGSNPSVQLVTQSVAVSQPASTNN